VRGDLVFFSAGYKRGGALLREQGLIHCYDIRAEKAAVGR
jgi:hypothetical protein